MESWEEVTEFVVVLEMSPPPDITEKSMHSRGIQCLLPLEEPMVSFELDVWRIFQLLKMKKTFGTFNENLKKNPTKRHLRHKLLEWRKRGTVLKGNF